MPKKTWLLDDWEEGISVAQITLEPENVGGKATGYSVLKRTLQGGLRQGVEVIEVNNGLLRFVVVPTRGMGIWKASLGDVQLGWQSPVKGPVHPAFVRLWEPSGLGWLDGFDEMLVRCGLESNGAPEFNANGPLRYPLHGKIANLPAHKLELSIDGDSGEIAVTGTVDEARLFGNKLQMVSTIATQAGSPTLTVTDTVTNVSGRPGELEMLYHVNFGVPLVSAGARVVLPVRRMAPRDAAAVPDVDTWDTYHAEDPWPPEAVFYFDLAADAQGNTQTLLRNAAGSRGVSLRFNKSCLPCFTLWKNGQTAADGYVTGLEPGTNFPNIKSFEKQAGRVVALGPGESRTFQLAIEAHADAASVAAAEAAVAALQQGSKPEILRQHDPQWSRG